MQKKQKKQQTKYKYYNQWSHCMFASGKKAIILNSCINNECKYFPLGVSWRHCINKAARYTIAKPISSQDCPHPPTESPKMFLFMCSSCFLNCPLLARLSATRTSEALRLVPLGERPQRPVSLMKPDKCAPRLCRTRMQDGVTAVTAAPAECKIYQALQFFFSTYCIKCSFSLP